MTTAKVFSDALSAQFKTLYGVLADNPVGLGDFGSFSDGVFSRQGNIRDLGISFTPVSGQGESEYNTTNASNLTVKSEAAGTLSIQGNSVTPKLTVEFERDDTVFFNAAGCSHSAISDINALGPRLEDLQDGKWAKNYVVITHVVNAAAVTIAISSGRNAKVSFEAQGEVKQIDLKDASLKLEVGDQSSIGYRQATTRGTPLIGLHELQPGAVRRARRGLMVPVQARR